MKATLIAIMLLSIVSAMAAPAGNDACSSTPIQIFNTPIPKNKLELISAQFSCNAKECDPTALQSWINKIAQPLDANWANNVISQYANPSIIGLGEPSHGSRALWKKRAELLFASAENKKTILAMELAPGEAMIMNEYLNGQRVFYPDFSFNLWNTPEEKEFFRKIKTFNQTATNKIELYGIDLHPSAQDFRLLKTKLASLKIDTTEELSAAFSQELVNKTYQSFMNIKVDNFDNQLQQAIAQLSKYIDILKASQDPSNSNILKATILLQARMDFYDAYKHNYATAFDMRDKYLAEHTEALQRANPDSTIILFAHNHHISKRSTDELSIKRMGYHLNQVYGLKYIAINSDFSRGNYYYVENNQIKEGTIKNFACGSLAQLLSKTQNNSDKLIEFPKEKNASFQHILIRDIGASADEKLASLNYDVTDPQKDIDAILFFMEN